MITPTLIINDKQYFQEKIPTRYTLTEVPILQYLLTSGMGQGPALALLLAGPSLSLLNMLVIRSVICIKKTLVYIGLVIIMATLSGLGWGMIIK